MAIAAGSAVIALGGGAAAGYALSSSSTSAHPQHQATASPSSPTTQSPQSRPQQSPNGQGQGQGQQVPQQPQQQPELSAGGFSGIMPSTIGVGQDGNQITGIAWSQWNSSQAVGTGQQGASIAACNAAGNDPTNPACQPVPVTITLAGVQNGQYTTITETANADSNFGPAGTSINSQYGPSVSSFIQSAS